MITGRIVFVFLLVCGLVVLGSVSAQQRDASRAGWISDESCGTQHTKPGRADCVQKCWRGGASVGHPEWKPQRAVFVADHDQGIWIVENPEAVRNFPAAHAVLPFYLAANSEGQSTWLQYLLFLAGIFPVSASFTLIYSRTGSAFLCLLFHGSLNAGAAHWFGPLPAGHLLPYALWIVLLWIAAIPVFRTLTTAPRRQPD